MRKDLKDTEVEESMWYGEARRSRPGWREIYCNDLEDCRQNQTVQAQEVVGVVVCKICLRPPFRRESDKLYHKCMTEQQKPVNEQ